MDEKLSREQWLEKSLRILNADSFGKLNIDRLVNSMGVSKGSFYWHFQGKADFVIQLVDYWENIFTLSVVEHIDRDIRNPAERLLELMEYVTLNQLAQFDFTIQSLAKSEPVVFAKVKQVFEKRFTYVASILSEIGFSGDELNFRARALVMFMTQEQNSLTRDAKEEQLKRLKIAHGVFTRR